MSSSNNDELSEMINKTARFVKKNMESTFTPENKAKLISLGKMAMEAGKNIKDQIVDNINLDDLSDHGKIQRRNFGLDDIMDRLNKK
jgi:hypothetical protein